MSITITNGDATDRDITNIMGITNIMNIATMIMIESPKGHPFQVGIATSGSASWPLP